MTIYTTLKKCHNCSRLSPAGVHECAYCGANSLIPVIGRYIDNGEFIEELPMHLQRRQNERV
jgi:hypothetical protein